MIQCNCIEAADPVVSTLCVCVCVCVCVCNEVHNCERGICGKIADKKGGEVHMYMDVDYILAVLLIIHLLLM